MYVLHLCTVYMNECSNAVWFKYIFCQRFGHNCMYVCKLYNQYRYVLSIILTNNDEHLLSNRAMRETAKALLAVL